MKSKKIIVDLAYYTYFFMLSTFLLIKSAKFLIFKITFFERYGIKAGKTFLVYKVKSNWWYAEDLRIYGCLHNEIKHILLQVLPLLVNTTTKLIQRSSVTALLHFMKTQDFVCASTIEICDVKSWKDFLRLN